MRVRVRLYKRMNGKQCKLTLNSVQQRHDGIKSSCVSYLKNKKSILAASTVVMFSFLFLLRVLGTFLQFEFLLLIITVYAASGLKMVKRTTQEFHHE